MRPTEPSWPRSADEGDGRHAEHDDCPEDEHAGGRRARALPVQVGLLDGHTGRPQLCQHRGDPSPAALHDPPEQVLEPRVGGVRQVGQQVQAAALVGAADLEAADEVDADLAGDVRDLVARDAWVTEWQYAPARPLLAARADLLVWVDPPFLRATFPRVVRRTLRRRLRREVLWNGNVEPSLWTFFTDPGHIVRWGISTRNATRHRVPSLVREAPHLRIVRLRTQREIDRFVQHLERGRG